jgi:hypothetical protein
MRWTALLFLALLASCATAKVAGECAGSEELRCMTRKVCAFDRTRGCQTCACESALNPAWNEPVRPEPAWGGTR